MQETQVQFLGQEDILEMEVAIQFSIFAWRISWTRNLVEYSPWGCKESYKTEWLTHTHTQFLCFYLLCYLSLLAFFTWTTITTSTLTSNVIAAPFFTLCLPGWSFWGPHLSTDLLGLILTHSPSLSSGLSQASPTPGKDLHLPSWQIQLSDSYFSPRKSFLLVFWDPGYIQFNI